MINFLKSNIKKLTVTKIYDICNFITGLAKIAFVTVNATFLKPSSRGFSLVDKNNTIKSLYSYIDFAKYFNNDLTKLSVIFISAVTMSFFLCEFVIENFPNSLKDIPSSSNSSILDLNPSNLASSTQNTRVNSNTEHHLTIKNYNYVLLREKFIKEREDWASARLKYWEYYVNQYGEIKKDYYESLKILNETLKEGNQWRYAKIFSLKAKISYDHAKEELLKLGSSYIYKKEKYIRTKNEYAQIRQVYNEKNPFLNPVYQDLECFFCIISSILVILALVRSNSILSIRGLIVISCYILFLLQMVKVNSFSPSEFYLPLVKIPLEDIPEYYKSAFYKDPIYDSIIENNPYNPTRSTPLDNPYVNDSSSESSINLAANSLTKSTNFSYVVEEFITGNIIFGFIAVFFLMVPNYTGVIKGKRIRNASILKKTPTILPPPGLERQSYQSHPDFFSVNLLSASAVSSSASAAAAVPVFNDPNCLATIPEHESTERRNFEKLDPQTKTNSDYWGIFPSTNGTILEDTKNEYTVFYPDPEKKPGRPSVEQGFIYWHTQLIIEMIRKKTRFLKNLSSKPQMKDQETPLAVYTKKEVKDAQQKVLWLRRELERFFKVHRVIPRSPSEAEYIGRTFGFHYSSLESRQKLYLRMFEGGKAKFLLHVKQKIPNGCDWAGLKELLLGSFDIPVYLTIMPPKYPYGEECHNRDGELADTPEELLKLGLLLGPYYISFLEKTTKEEINKVVKIFTEVQAIQTSKNAQSSDLLSRITSSPSDHYWTPSDYSGETIREWPTVDSSGECFINLDKTVKEAKIVNIQKVNCRDYLLISYLIKRFLAQIKKLNIKALKEDLERVKKESFSLQKKLGQEKKKTYFVDKNLTKMKTGLDTAKKKQGESTEKKR